MDRPGGRGRARAKTASEQGIGSRPMTTSHLAAEITNARKPAQKRVEGHAWSKRDRWGERVRARPKLNNEQSVVDKENGS